jgi:hypothetical protein
MIVKILLIGLIMCSELVKRKKLFYLLISVSNNKQIKSLLPLRQLEWFEKFEKKT